MSTAENVPTTTTHRAHCESCNVGVAGDLDDVTRWAVHHAYQRELEALEALRAGAHALASFSRSVVIETSTDHQVAISQLLVDPRPAGRDLER